MGKNANSRNPVSRVLDKIYFHTPGQLSSAYPYKLVAAGKARVTPLQYERVDGTFIVGSARGTDSDWYRNIVAEPRVEMRVGRLRLSGVATTCTDSARLAEFLELRLKRHPRMVGRILRLHGVPANPTTAQLATYASRLAMVTITPSEVQEVES